MNCCHLLVAARIELVATLFAAWIVGGVVAGEPIQVMTYNIRYQNRSDGEDIWENRSDIVIETIGKSDVVGLQEVLAGQFDQIQQQLPGWQWYGVGRDDGLRAGEMAAVGWNTKKLIALEQGTFWLSDSPYRVGKAAWDAALPRVASWVRLTSRRKSAQGEPTTVLVVNAHFDHRGVQARKQSAALLRKWISQNRGPSSAILIGDLNATVGSPPLDELLLAEAAPFPVLVDAKAHTANPATGPNSTWNGFKQIADGQRIDHILYQGEGIRVVNYTTLDPRTPAGRFASDHLPVLAEIEYN
ncbi:MAG: endonuclease/exonuclease/phosphatase family protein [Pirellulaceae bacterium]|nr:endonuclease/exonuclease/phosphatase family protein [Pirellulaceae bacterium]